jgi:hypothetical protein
VKRQMRRWMGLLLVPLALGSCGTGTGTTEISPGTSDRWHVSVLGPRDGAVIDHCLEDPLIEQSVESLDLPSTHLGVKLLGTATRVDAERIANCLEPGVGSAAVSITSPRTTFNTQNASADSQITTPKVGEQRGWPPERMRSASPEPVPTGP